MDNGYLLKMMEFSMLASFLFDCQTMNYRNIGFDLSIHTLGGKKLARKNRAL